MVNHIVDTAVVVILQMFFTQINGAIESLFRRWFIAALQLHNVSKECKLWQIEYLQL